MDRIITKPWGYEQILFENYGRVRKNIVVMQGQQISLQYHHKRDEDWEVKVGLCEIQIGDEKFKGLPFTKWRIPKLTKHRVYAITNTLIEEYSENFDVNDIVRLEDSYGRSTEKTE